MGNCYSQTSGQQVFGYYPCNCVEPILTNTAPVRSIGFFPNDSIAVYRYLRKRRQKDTTELEGMVFCGLFNNARNKTNNPFQQSATAMCLLPITCPTL